MQDPSQLRIELNREPFHTAGWFVEPLRNTLTREGQPVHLEPKVMDVLACLARRAGSVVSKEELIRDVWENRFVTEDVITVSIHELRKALGDSARQPQFIETIPRRGYRWIANVSAAAEVAASVQAPPRAAANRRWLAVAATCAVIASLGAWAFTWPGWRGTPSSARSPEAQAAYLKARHFLDQRTRDGYSQALSYFRESVRLDPEFAEAHAGIARANAMTADAGFGDRLQLYERAREAAQRALDLNANSAEAHVAMGMIRLVFDWDFADAGRHLRRGIELKPSLMEAHQIYAWLLSAIGRHEEAIAEARLAARLDPASSPRCIELAWALSYSGEYGQAIAETDKALELDPHNFGAHLSKGMLLELMGNTPAAYAAIRAAYLQRTGGEKIVVGLDATYRREGLRGIYRSWLRLTQSGAAPTMPRNEVWRASLHSRIGEVDEAIAALQRAYALREGGMAWLRVNPSFMPLRYDQRFQTLLQQVGLAN